ncbi:putative transcription factor C2H2 family [Medicago truncatula]|uniref:Putative transcription factor C2H2 family n=1 Tax=Medicago truncatula TaxID=3880 RepID=G7JTL6_MEDTR|nr:hypothetical protein MTR_4g039640 [Medicago truncatula]RHN59931.1 putative transcription factor C2H2 family [Medicago truncatula]
MSKLGFLCSECDTTFPSPQTLAVHVIEEHHPYLILESSKQGPPLNNQPQPENAQPQLQNDEHQPQNAPVPPQNAPAPPQNVEHQPQNASPPHVQPFDLNQPPNVRVFDLNLPYISDE